MTHLVGLSVSGWYHPNDTKIQEGDIVSVLHPENPIGKKMKTRWLWFIAEDASEGLKESESVLGTWHRRYKVDLEQLAMVVPFDLARVRDVKDPYQPFIHIDEVDGNIIPLRPPISLLGLVYDKLETRYI